VYMLGGLLYEILTVGKVPFHWLLPLYSTESLHRRRISAEDVPDSSGQLRRGLLGKNVLEAAVIDGVEVPWSVQEAASPGSASRLVEAKLLVGRCCQWDPIARPATEALSDTLSSLLDGEREVVPKPDVEPELKPFTSLQVGVGVRALVSVAIPTFAFAGGDLRTACFPTRTFCMFSPGVGAACWHGVPRGDSRLCW
jgi:hypothetical protein